MYVVPTATFGGAPRNLACFLQELENTKFVPHIATAHNNEFMKETFAGVNSICLNFSTVRIPNRIILFLRRYLPHRISVILNFSYEFCLEVILAIRLYKFGKECDVSLVYVNDGLMLSGVLVAKLLKVPCVVHCHAYNWPGFLNRHLSPFVDHIIAVSQSVKNHLVNRVKVPVAQISVIYSTFDAKEFNSNVDVSGVIDEFKPETSELFFGLFGRIVDWKGQLEFVRATAKVLQQVPNARAFIVGDISDGAPEYLEKVKLLAEELNISDRIVFTGYRENPASIMALMNVVVHASIEPEPCGMVILEAMSMKKPVVASACGGPLELIKNRKSGLLVPPGDDLAMADAIIELLNNHELASEISNNGYESVIAKFSSKIHARKVQHIFEELLD